MDLPLKMMNKNGVVMARLARELISMLEGDRIDTVSSYAKRFDSARGTVQKVLKLLEKEEAIALEKKGHLGTYITLIDYNKLWQFTYWGVLTGASPLPYTRKHEGLATAMYYQMEKRNIPFSFAYMQGAENRARGLLNERYDFIILSKESAQELISKHDELEIAIEFKPYSYLSGYALIYLEEKYKEIVDGMRIGIDYNSPDHVKLIKALCKNKRVEYVELQYTRILPSLIMKDIDATVYNKDTIDRPEIKSLVSYENINLTDLDGNEKTKAVILINKKAFGIKHILNQIIDIDEVYNIQNQIIAGNMIPTY